MRAGLRKWKCEREKHVETPQEDNDGYAEEIRLLRAAAQAGIHKAEQG